jgi:3-phytase
VRSSLNESTFLVTRGSGSGYGPVANTKLINNTVYMTGSASQGFVCHAGCNSSILSMRNNVIQAVAKVGYADGAFDEDYNLYFGGQVQFSTGSHSTVGNPMFINPAAGDLHLNSGSPAIDSAINSGYTADFDGVSVPSDGNGDGAAATDRGAFEKGGSAVVTPAPAPTPSPAPVTSPAPAGNKTATAETDPVPNTGDAADDPAIWVNPSNPALSTIIGTNKLGGLAVYDLSGKQLHYYGGIRPNNVDVRYGFNLGGTQVDIVTASETDSDTILVYRIDPGSRGLVDVRASARDTGFGVAGLCMYKSPSSGRYYVFVSDSSGNVRQFELIGTGGAIDYTLVRSLGFGSVTEGCVADDHHGTLYISQEDVALWRLSAEPGGGSAKTQIATVDGNVLTADLEGLAISDSGNGAGHLVASSQGSNDFVLFDRQTGAYRGRFAVVSGAVDGVDHTDGIDITSKPLGAAFPGGVFVAQDNTNSGGNQNFKLVPWNASAP